MANIRTISPQLARVIAQTAKKQQETADSAVSIRKNLRFLLRKVHMVPCAAHAAARKTGASQFAVD